MEHLLAAKERLENDGSKQVALQDVTNTVSSSSKAATKPIDDFDPLKEVSAILNNPLFTPVKYGQDNLGVGVNGVSRERDELSNDGSTEFKDMSDKMDVEGSKPLD